jgi:hypothetical protein
MSNSSTASNSADPSVIERPTAKPSSIRINQLFWYIEKNLPTGLGVFP